ncbi:MAG: cysteine--tRNA ligase [Gammaproteobacteria bacterium]|nr:MAG: cysteine--tRNA ligase [Gammaproteobacteria bacterium]
MLLIFNSLTGRKEEFRPLVPGQVRMYVCGMTVYDYCHVGHARSQIAFDVVRRWLQASGYRVTFVRNITDIDDNIIQRAREQGEDYRVLTERYIRAADADFAALGILLPDHEPRATAYMPQMIAMIGTLIGRGHAYVSDSGDVLYSVSSFAGYGRLSGKKLEDLRAGARVEVDAHKRDPLDFVLWKRAKPGEPAWDSPWGPGRPGWHIECSAMSVALLGVHFDIHGGGADLRFPHHENEIAQTCAACDSPFVNVWMHNGFVRLNDEKMSKSLGNFFTVREVLPRLRPEVLRAFLLASHYRGPINYTEDNVRQADAALQRLYLALRGVNPAAAYEPGAATAAFRAAMDDDFNTPEALAALQSGARALNIARAAGDAARAGPLAAELRALGAVLGLLQHDPEGWLATRSELMAAAGSEPQRLEPAAIDALVARRSAARKSRDFAGSDRIRDELAAHGVVLEDGPAGTSWRWR